MSYYEAKDRELYSKLIQFYPRVEPGHAFVSNLFNEFGKQDAIPNYEDPMYSWAKRLEQWLPGKVGLIRNPDDADNWDKFIVVDQGLYAFALLRYS